MLQTICGLVLLAAVAGSAGCIGGYMSSQDPGRTPRDGELLSVAPFGSEQVQFTFRFKAGADPNLKTPAGVPVLPPPQGASKGRGEGNSSNDAGRAAPAPVLAGADVRITRVVLTDRLGRSYDIVDQEVRRAGNLFHLVITTQAVTPETYELTCQVDAQVSEFQLRLAVAATREADSWRAVPRSFKFAVYGESERSPYEFNILNRSGR